MGSPWSQAGSRIRFEWGPRGAREISAGAGAAVVVDVLSFTTTVSVAADRGIEVLPYQWRDEGAREYADRHGATLAIGRLEARDQAGEVSLSPAHLRQVEGVRRLVLPSPNGSVISFGLADSGATVVAACLRNRTAMADWLVEQDGPIAVVAAGERWRDDDSLRPCLEDLLGGGAVIAALQDRGVTGASPEAEAAAATFRAHEHDLSTTLRRASGALELTELGFADDVDVAAELDTSTSVPVLDRAIFRPVRLA